MEATPGAALIFDTGGKVPWMHEGGDMQIDHVALWTSCLESAV
jgi:hypothetical protein